jgi:hypothetical protein
MRTIFWSTGPGFSSSAEITGAEQIAAKKADTAIHTNAVLLIEASSVDAVF